MNLENFKQETDLLQWVIAFCVGLGLSNQALACLLQTIVLCARQVLIKAGVQLPRRAVVYLVILGNTKVDTEWQIALIVRQGNMEAHPARSIVQTVALEGIRLVWAFKQSQVVMCVILANSSHY